MAASALLGHDDPLAQSAAQRGDQIGKVAARLRPALARRISGERGDQRGADAVAHLLLQLRDAGIARGFGHDLRHQAIAVDILVIAGEGQYPLVHRGPVAGEDRLVQRRFVEELREIAARDGDDDILLRGEVPVDLADLDPARAGDLRDAGSVEAVFDEQAAGSFEDMLTAAGGA